jgi:Predicted redox protein, regulator of disulfide bond formation
MEEKVSLKWLEGMAFEGEVNGHKLTVDADENVGGKNAGPRPKPLMLLALAGCTAMDVVSILGKMKMPYDEFSIDVVSNKTEEHPTVYTDFKILYKFKGKGLDMEKITKAVDLSQEKYCGVSAMYRQFAPVTFEIAIEE